MKKELKSKIKKALKHAFLNTTSGEIQTNCLEAINAINKQESKRKNKKWGI